MSGWLADNVIGQPARGVCDRTAAPMTWMSCSRRPVSRITGLRWTRSRMAEATEGARDGGPEA